jgi:hypothetical protein
LAFFYENNFLKIQSNQFKRKLTSFIEVKIDVEPLTAAVSTFVSLVEPTRENNAHYKENTKFFFLPFRTLDVVLIIDVCLDKFG